MSVLNYDWWSDDSGLDLQKEGQDSFNCLCSIWFWYASHPCVTAVACKRPWSFCQKRRCMVTAKHAYTFDPSWKWVHMRLVRIGSSTVISACCVSLCFEPSQPQRITSGLNTNFTRPPGYSFHKSFDHKSCFLRLFLFRGHSTREPVANRVT